MKIVEVGEPEEGKRTSPIWVEGGDVEKTGQPICWFNDQEFAEDEMVYSGAEILRCDAGVWVRSGQRQG